MIDKLKRKVAFPVTTYWC